MQIKHAAEPGDKQKKDTRRQGRNNQAAKSSKNYFQSSELPVQSQGPYNTLESNLISDLVHFPTTVITSLALRDREIFLRHLLWKHSKPNTLLLATS